MTDSKSDQLGPTEVLVTEPTEQEEQVEVKPSFLRVLLEEMIKVLIILIIWGLSVGLAIGGGQYSQTIIGPLTAFGVCGIISYGIQFVGFIPAFIFKTEKFFDVIGSLTYISMTVAAFIMAGDNYSAGSLTVGLMVILWAVRLGTFLFIRIMQDGNDSRFDEIKKNFLRFFISWNLQGLWVFVTASPAIAIITSSRKYEMVWLTYVGLALWVIGFGIEIVADQQKRSFRKKRQLKQTSTEWIQEGLWSISRHPNYFGEIMLWLGVTLMAIPILRDWQFVVLSSPVLVTLLLTKVSGIPMVESKSDERWGKNPEYRKYKQNTPVLVPFTNCLRCDNKED